MQLVSGTDAFELLGWRRVVDSRRFVIYRSWAS
jgi:hypothetical protein